MARCSATRVGLLAALAALAPATSGAVVELRSNLTMTQGHNDNVLTREEDEIADQVTTVSPELSLRASNERGSLGASGRLTARRYADVDALDALDRAFAVNGDYWITPRLQITGSGRDAYYDNTDELMENGVPVLGDSPELDTQQWSGSLRYRVSPRTALTLSPSFADWNFGASQDPDSDERNDSSSTSLTAGIERTLSVRDTVGLALTQAENEFDQDPGVPDSESIYYNARMSWSRVWGPIWSSSLSAGATQVRQDAQDLDFSGFDLVTGQAPVIGVDDETLAGVGELLVTRRTPWTTFQLSGSQTVSPSSGFGTDLTVLTLSTRLDWNLNRRWTFTVGAFFSDSQATSDTLDFTAPLSFAPGGVLDVDAKVQYLWDTPTCNANSAAIFVGNPIAVVDAAGNPVKDAGGNEIRLRNTSCFGQSDAAVNYQQQGFNLGLSWRMTRRFSTFLSYRFLDQSTGGDTDLDEFNQNVVSLGFTYRYDVDLY